MENREASCAERLPEHLASRVADLADLYRRGNEGDEDAHDELFDYPLGVSLERVLRVDLSTGGPADWLELFYQQDESRPHRIVYHFADWFDHAERTLEGDDFDAAETAFGDVIDGFQS